jgi:hypothetical protein
VLFTLGKGRPQLGLERCGIYTQRNLDRVRLGVTGLILDLPFKVCCVRLKRDLDRLGLGLAGLRPDALFESGAVQLERHLDGFRLDPSGLGLGLLFKRPGIWFQRDFDAFATAGFRCRRQFGANLLCDRCGLGRGLVLDLDRDLDDVRDGDPPPSFARLLLWPTHGYNPFGLQRPGGFFQHL